MSSLALNQLFAVLKVKANVFHNGQYCGMWAVDSSGSNLMNFHVVTRGQCQAIIGDEVYQLGLGDAIFMPSDDQHRVTGLDQYGGDVGLVESFPMNAAIEEESTGLVCGNFTHEHPIFERLLEQLPNVIVVRYRPGEIISDILNLILKESETAGMGPNFLLDRLADALFYALVRDNVNTQCGVLAAMTHPKLAKSFELIHNNFDQQLNVELLAESAAMSRSAFSSLFKELVEMSPSDYISQWRMTQAYRWLADESISTFEAATRCGYESEASFSKAFKRVIGVGPGEVRQISKAK